MSRWTLVCERCGTAVEAAAAIWHCDGCGGPLAWQVERRFDRTMIDREASGFWRYAATLPLPQRDSVSFGESTTPLVEIELDGGRPLAKLDFLLPSGSYKDRGAAVLISALKSLGATHAVEDSSGNAAAAISAYAARANLRCTVFAPAAASPGKLVQSQIYGATVRRIGGSRDDVAQAAMDAAAAEPGSTYASHNWHPFFIEGVKTWAFEVWEQLGYAVPDAVVAPAGSGSMILGASLAFGALLAAGEIAKLPRLYAAQPAACAPLAAALDAGADDTTPFPRTQPWPKAPRSPIRSAAVNCYGQSGRAGGCAVAVSEEAIVDGTQGSRPSRDLHRADLGSRR